MGVAEPVTVIIGIRTVRRAITVEISSVRNGGDVRVVRVGIGVEFVTVAVAVPVVVGVGAVRCAVTIEVGCGRLWSFVGIERVGSRVDFFGVEVAVVIVVSVGAVRNAVSVEVGGRGLWGVGEHHGHVGAEVYLGARQWGLFHHGVVCGVGGVVHIADQDLHLKVGAQHFFHAGGVQADQRRHRAAAWACGYEQGDGGATCYHRVGRGVGAHHGARRHFRVGLVGHGDVKAEALQQVARQQFWPVHDTGGNRHFVGAARHHDQHRCVLTYL